MADEYAMDDTDTGTEEESTEPLGAQILRRMHEDLSILMEDYHGLLDALEQPDVKDYMTGHLEGIEETLSMTEELFNKVYAELPGLGEGGGKDLEEETPEEEAVEDKDIDTAETGSVESTSGDRAEEAPDGEEVIEGMERDKKSLYAKSRMMKVLNRLGKKSVCPKCGKDPCVCGSKCVDGNERHSGPCKNGKNAKSGLTAEEATTADEPMSETTDPAHPQSDISSKALEADEKPIVAEAAMHLKSLSEAQGMDSEARFKSYHYHKMLDDLSGIKTKTMPVGDTTTDSGVASTATAGDSGMMSLNRRKGVRDVTPDMEDLSADERDNGKYMRRKKDWHSDYDEPDTLGIGDGGGDSGSMHAHRKACMMASKFLKSMAYSKDFGDPHRMEALAHHKALDGISKEEMPTEVVDDADRSANVEEPGEPGTMGEKGLEKLKAMVLQQDKEINQLASTLATIGSNL